MAQHKTPLADSYVAAYEAARAAEQAYEACECGVCKGGGPASDCPTHRARLDAEARLLQAREAWLRSDEIRAYEFGGDSYPGGAPETFWHRPSEVADALAEWTREGEWDRSGPTFWVRDWACPRDPANGERLEEEVVTVCVAFDPDEPECTADEHEWESPQEVVGGMEDNPGVYGHGGGVVITEVCRHCGVYRVRDTWAQDPATGAQGLESVEYRPADEASRSWIASGERILPIAGSDGAHGAPSRRPQVAGEVQ